MPYLRYEDPRVGLRWVVDVLGGTEALRLTLDDGTVGHAEAVLGSSVIALGVAYTPPTDPDPSESRYTLRQMTLVYVDDVDATVERAVAAGGTVVEQPTDQPWGLRQAILRDPEGYLWEPSRHLVDVEPSAWGAELLGALPG